MQVSEAFLAKVFSAVDADPKAEVKIDLQNQEITLIPTGEKESFEINSYKKSCLLNGYDDIDYLLAMKDKIVAFEKQAVKF